MPTWGIHLLIAKKLNKKLQMKDYNSFLLGNIIVDVNNGYIVPNVSKRIEHKKTHYYTKSTNTANIGHYDIKQCIKENEENMQHPVVLGYITHLMADSYWNDLTYKKYGIYNEKNELIGLKLNNGKNLIVDGETRRRIKTDDFKIFTNDIYKNQWIDIPKYEESIYEQIKQIPSVDMTREDIKKAIEYLNKVKNGLDLIETEYKIFTQDEMMEQVDLCVENVISQLKNNEIVI